MSLGVKLESRRFSILSSRVLLFDWVKICHAVMHSTSFDRSCIWYLTAWSQVESSLSFDCQGCPVLNLGKSYKFFRFYEIIISVCVLGASVIIIIIIIIIKSSLSRLELLNLGKYLVTFWFYKILIFVCVSGASVSPKPCHSRDESAGSSLRCPSPPGAVGGATGVSAVTFNETGSIMNQMPPVAFGRYHFITVE